MPQARKRSMVIQRWLVIAGLLAAALPVTIADAQTQPGPAPAKAPPGGSQVPSILGPPPVRFDPDTLDLGTLKPGADANGVVMIHNISDKWLTIKASKASCTCTAINLANTTVAPGQAIPMDVSYHASSTMGSKQAAVRILFEGYDLVEVPIVAFVGLPVRSEPLYIDALKKVDGTQALSGQYTVYSLDQKPFRVLAVNGKPPEFTNFDPSVDSLRTSYILKWDLTGYDPNNGCKNAAGEHMPGWIIVETDHPEAPIFDLEIRNDCNRRKPATQMDYWAVSDKRVLLGAVKPGEPAEAQVLLKWLPQREHAYPPTAVVSESTQFTAELAGVKPQEDGLMVTLRITPAKDAKGLIYGSLRLHSNRQSGPVQVIATVR